MGVTTIKLECQTKRQLDQFREYGGESYDHVVRKVVFIAKTALKNPKLSQQTVQEIEAARERIRKGDYHTEHEAKRLLGI